VVEVRVRHRPVEPDRFGGHRQRQADRVVGLDDAELAGGDRDPGLAPAVDRVDGGGLGRRADRDPQVDVPHVAHRAGELQFR